MEPGHPETESDEIEHEGATRAHPDYWKTKVKNFVHTLCGMQTRGVCTGWFAND